MCQFSSSLKEMPSTLAMQRGIYKGISNGAPALLLVVLISSILVSVAAAGGGKRLVPRNGRIWQRDAGCNHEKICLTPQPDYETPNGNVTRVVLAPCSGNKRNRWAFKAIKDGVWHIRNTQCPQGNERLCECIAPDLNNNNGSAVGAPLLQYNCLDAAAYFPDDIAFRFIHVGQHHGKTKGWKIQHIRSGSYVSLLAEEEDESEGKKQEQRDEKEDRVYPLVNLQAQPHVWRIV
ncbi:uncharacterized protein EV422DRAFT_527451, partial [Fimicolochytrium jonesii]|uniref:uncharacterized protein n=1 Tax=Fimicolochytrium jonesii TaxID=1396493 RepID=UPI0022FE9963